MRAPADKRQRNVEAGGIEEVEEMKGGAGSESKGGKIYEILSLSDPRGLKNENVCGFTVNI